MPDAPAAPATPEPTPKPEDSKTEDATGGADKDPKSGEKLFSQADVDRLIKDRLDRAAKKAETDSQKVREDAEAKALESQNEFQKLAEQRGKKLETLTAERDALVAERDAVQGKAARYEKALNHLLDTHKAGVPEHVKPLLERLDPVEQLDWIAANGGKVTPNGVPMTPKADGRGLSEEQKRAIQTQTDRDYRTKL